MLHLIFTVPAYNEAGVLEDTITTLHAFLTKHISGFSWKIVIANNASTDATGAIADALAARLPQVDHISITYQGRGNALRHVFTHYDAGIYAYCDADLSTDLACVTELLAATATNDIAIGSRYVPGAHATRSLKRLIISKGFIYLVRLFFDTRLRDLQCGFKAVRRSVVREILPLVKDNGWFFDTELLLIAENKKYRIKEVPVSWHENPRTSVRFARTITNYIISIFKLKRRLHAQKTATP